jgi:hypothetical protein
MSCRFVPQVLPRWRKAANWPCWPIYQIWFLSGATTKVNECFASHLASQTTLPFCAISWLSINLIWWRIGKLSVILSLLPLPHRPVHDAQAGREACALYDSSQVPGDACCPGLNSWPVAEVALGSPHRLHHHPFSERQMAMVEGPEEDPLITRSDRLPELSYLLRLRFGILDLRNRRLKWISNA